MINDQRILAVIPARGGSKRLPRKNVLNLAGKPLIAWSIEAALQSKYIDRVVVSTDDNEIANVSKQHGADVPFLRPEQLATDEATSMDAVLHVIEKLEDSGEVYDYIMLLQPTSPLRNVADIDGAINQLFERKHNSIISVCEAEHSPLWTNTLPKNMSMANFLPKEILNARSQDLEKYYKLNGAIYITKVSSIVNAETPTFFLSEKASAYLMPMERSVDIDGVMDFYMARILIEEMNSNDVSRKTNA